MRCPLGYCSLSNASHMLPNGEDIKASKSLKIARRRPARIWRERTDCVRDKSMTWLFRIMMGFPVGSSYCAKIPIHPKSPNRESR